MIFSLVIPAYNEANRIAPSIAWIAKYLRSRSETWEVIVVDDGSRDGTASAAREAAKASDLPLRVIELPVNRGKGAAVRAGVLESRGEWILISDADLSTPIEEWEKLRESGAPIAIGSRALDETLIRRKQPWYRRTMGKTFNLFVRLFSIRGIRDTQCGFKWFEGNLARDLFSRATIDRFAYDVEILSMARRRGVEIAEVPVVWINSPQSKVAVVIDSIRMLRDLARIRLGSKRDG
jgi:dolichyl-phosphate beta-glucosyltransferase